jgi:Predicted restriction endonuclease
MRDLPLHSKRPNETTFRNPSGVYLHLLSFLRFDDAHKRDTCNSHSKLAACVWEDYAEKVGYLREVADAICRCYPALIATIDSFDIDERCFFEGHILYRIHRKFESDELILKPLFLKIQSRNKCECSICGFRFSELYDAIEAKKYIEFHHLVKVTLAYPNMPLYPADFTPVCSNCHKILHRIRPWITKKNIRSILRRTTDV